MGFENFTAWPDDLVDDVGCRGNEVDIEFPGQPFTSDVHVQQPEESATETEPERGRGFGLELDCRIVELQFFKASLS